MWCSIQEPSLIVVLTKLGAKTLVLPTSIELTMQSMCRWDLQSPRYIRFIGFVSFTVVGWERFVALNWYIEV